MVKISGVHFPGREELYGGCRESPDQEPSHEDEDLNDAPGSRELWWLAPRRQPPLWVGVGLDMWKSQISWSQVSIQMGDPARMGWGLSQQKATIPLSDVLVCFCPALVSPLLMVKDCSCQLCSYPSWHGAPEKSLACPQC